MAADQTSPMSLKRRLEVLLHETGLREGEAGVSGISILDDAHALADHVGVPFISLCSVIKEVEARQNSPDKVSAQLCRQQSEDAQPVPKQRTAGQVTEKMDWEDTKAKIAKLQMSESELEHQLTELRSELARLKLDPSEDDTINAAKLDNAARILTENDEAASFTSFGTRDLRVINAKSDQPSDPLGTHTEDTVNLAEARQGQGTCASCSITVMLSGLPGRMCVEVGTACLRKGFGLADTALSGPRKVGPRWMRDEIDLLNGSTRVTIRVVTADEPGAQLKALQEAKSKYGASLVVVDFTHPSAVNTHAELYATAGVPFVMGTMGGDRDALLRTAESSGVQAFIAPTMCKQLAAFEAAMVRMASDFPGAFAGYRLDVVESHPSNMADTSMTAKTMVQAFQRLGVEATADRIQKIRSEEGSMALGVPKHALDSHSFHRFTLTSIDGTSTFQLQHKITGFKTYAESTLDAILFLMSRTTGENKHNVFYMQDLLAAELRT